MSTTELTVRFYLDAIRRRWWLVVLTAVAAVAVGVVVSGGSEPTYTSTVSVRVTGTNGGDLEAEETDIADGSVDRYVFEVLTDIEVIESTGFRADVEERLGPDVTFGDVSAGLDGFSSVVRISVSSDRAEDAARAATAYGEEYIERRRADVVDPLLDRAERRRAERAEALDEIAALDSELADPATAPLRRDSLRLERAALAQEARRLAQSADELELAADERARRTVVVSPAEVPAATADEGLLRTLVVALALGLGVGLVLCVVLELLRDRVADADDLAALDPNVPAVGAADDPVAVIADEVRAGAAGPVTRVAVVTLCTPSTAGPILEGLRASFEEVVVVDASDAVRTDTIPAGVLAEADAVVVVAAVGTTRRSDVRAAYGRLGQLGHRPVAAVAPSDRAAPQPD